jgi:hypothetical protein
MAVSRPGKLSHSQTILYEIDLFRYAANKLKEDKWQSEIDKWVYLEAFLLHFRNLIEFFGNADSRQDTLSILRTDRFWPDLANRPDAELAQMPRPELWEIYEGKGNPEKISKYLQHCTEQRIDPKNWEIGEMFNELCGSLDRFEQLLPNKTRTWETPVLRVGGALTGSESAGTNTVTKY